VITNVSASEDVFRFYLGPKTAAALDRYDNPGDNAFGLSALDLGAVVERNFLIGWLEWILQQLLALCHRVVRNWGVAIIIVTLIIKLLLYPLTIKSTKSMAKTQALTPQIEELRKKYANNPQKLNQEMSNIYKKEGINPLSGCLPLLLQFPIIIAMYGVVSKYFDLRGAVFIPGWITDLSAAEAVYTFKNFSIPLLNWDAIRLLPVIFVLSQLLYGKLTQGGNAANSQMKMLNMLMPVMFFFILYNSPSGLLVYWIAQNIFSMVQQVFIMRTQKAKEQAGQPPAPSRR